MDQYFFTFVLMHILLTIIFLTNVIAHFSMHICLENALKNDHIMIMIIIVIILVLSFLLYASM